MKAWLKCRVDEGMFSDERAVTYPRSKLPLQKSVFVSSSFVRSTSENEGEVMVSAWMHEGVRFALLPTPDQDIVTVEEADLLA